MEVLLFAFLSAILWISPLMSQEACDSEIFCHGIILDTVQRAQLFLDPKRFVDMPTKHPKQTVLENFRKLGNSTSATDLQEFLDSNFHRAGHEIKVVMPADFKSNPTFLKDILDPKLRDFALTIHSKWKSLLRKIDKSLICKECESTALDLPFPFLVPGGRFREYYYWDTFWILEGIYVSEMCKTAKSVIENTLWMANKYGFVPNGSRTYYLNRSQPPMLPMMIDSFLTECPDMKNPKGFLRRAMTALEKEHQFWMNNRSVAIKDTQGKVHVLNHYSADMSAPRPESYIHDMKLAEAKTDNLSKALFHNIASTTESGWDFSGRWLNWSSSYVDSFPGLDQSITSSIVPVDLNALLFRNELIMSHLYGKLNNSAAEKKFKLLAESRADAINTILFSKELNMWRDYNLNTEKLMTERPFYITDICPFWYGPYKYLKPEEIEAILVQHKGILEDYPGGIPISESYTGQQWDFPNVWAPTQFLAVKLYLRLFKETGKKEHFDRAVQVAQKWITTTYCGYKHFGYVFEKYNAKVVGQPGGGGEYIVQEGFGWSNGVILWMLKQLGPHLTVPQRCPNLPIQNLKGKLDDGDHDDFIDAMTMFVWIMTLLLSATFAVVIIAKLRRPPPRHNEDDAYNLIT